MHALISSFVENISFCSVIIGLLGTIISFKLFLPLFISLKFLDKPTDRSNHIRPIALGGGVIVVPIIILVSSILNFQWPAVIIIVMSILFLISFLDDLKNLGASLRLITHIFCAGIYFYFYIFAQIEIPIIINNDFLTIIICVLSIAGIAWFINAFNFMDGIDGITGIQIIFLTGSLILFNYYLNYKSDLLQFTVIGATLGFLFFNWSPAKVFLGDSGSIPLGFLMTHFLIDFALKGFWVAALILPMYYILDTSVTLIIRIFRKESFWKAHSQHFYQKLVRRGKTHEEVCTSIIIISLGLFILALSSVLVKNNSVFLILSFIWCTFFLLNFSKNNKIIKND